MCLKDINVIHKLFLCKELTSLHLPFLSWIFFNCSLVRKLEEINVNSPRREYS